MNQVASYTRVTLHPRPRRMRARMDGAGAVDAQIAPPRSLQNRKRRRFIQRPHAASIREEESRTTVNTLYTRKFGHSADNPTCRAIPSGHRLTVTHRVAASARLAGLHHHYLLNTIAASVFC